MSQTGTCHQVTPVLITNQSMYICSLREGLNKHHWKNSNAIGHLEAYSCSSALPSPDLSSPIHMGSRWPDYHTQLLLGITYLTEREKSPGALSLSLMRKAPSCLCLPNISSAFARGIFPKNHLWMRKTTGKEENCNSFMEEPDVDIHTKMKWFLTEITTLHLAATPIQATEPCSFS